MLKDSYLSLQQLINKVNNHLLSLETLDEPVKEWNTMIYLVFTKLYEHEA